MSQHFSQEGLIKGSFLCIVNPNSGTGAALRFASKLNDRSKFSRDVQTVLSKSPEHSIELAATAGTNGFAAVLAVGGDGSVHEIAAQLINGTTALGIIPTGSGNGVARHLKVSMDPMKALEQMLIGKVRRIDTFTVNNRPAIGFAGVGIDGHVANLFENTSIRGFANYVKLTVGAFGRYKPTAFGVQISDSKSLPSTAWTVVIANTSQFGNNAVMNATGADDDGLLELIIVKNISKTAMLGLAANMFLGRLHKSPAVSITQGTHFRIQNLGGAAMHIDGEALGSQSSLEVAIVPRSLNIITP